MMNMNNFNSRVYIQPKQFGQNSQHIIRSQSNSQFQTPTQNKLDLHSIHPINTNNQSESRILASHSSPQRSIFRSSNRSLNITNDINSSSLPNHILQQFQNQNIHKSLNLASIQITKYNQSIKSILKKSKQTRSKSKTKTNIRFNQNVAIIEVENWKQINKENTFITPDENNSYCCGYQSDDHSTNSCLIF